MNPDGVDPRCKMQEGGGNQDDHLIMLCCVCGRDGMDGGGMGWNGTAAVSVTWRNIQHLKPTTVLLPVQHDWTRRENESREKRRRKSRFNIK